MKQSHPLVHLQCECHFSLQQPSCTVTLSQWTLSLLMSPPVPMLSIRLCTGLSWYPAAVRALWVIEIMKTFISDEDFRHLQTNIAVTVSYIKDTACSIGLYIDLVTSQLCNNEASVKGRLTCRHI